MPTFGARCLTPLLAGLGLIVVACSDEGTSSEQSGGAAGSGNTGAQAGVGGGSSAAGGSSGTSGANGGSATSGAGSAGAAGSGAGTTSDAGGSAGASSAGSGGSISAGAAGTGENGGAAGGAGAGGSLAGAGQGGDGAGGSAGSTAGSSGASGTGASGGTGGSGPAGPVVAFPGAEGFGRNAVGARGGDVYHVTNLDDSGPGSFRDAISAPNRTIVFEVSGVIKPGERLIFSRNLTVAGQTAPGGGITIYGNGTSFTTADNTIVRYLRFRMGAIGDSGKDTITIAAGHDIIFDHCSISWGRDGNFDLNQESGRELENITLQDSIVAQGLQTHSTGGLINGNGVSVLRSLWIDNNSRNPKARMTLQWVNNVIYNWVVSAYILGDTSGRSDGYMVGNYFIPGPETNGGTLDSPTSAYNLYASGNYYDSDKDGALGGRLLGQGDYGSVTWHTTPSVDFPEVTELSAQEAFAHVSEHAGASLYRDAPDEYVLAELASLGKSGKTISNETSLGLPNVVGNLPGGEAPADADRDGMADAWETANGLNPGDASDRNGDRNGDGYTNLEEYINGLAR